jgi:hypothetical protein
MNLDALNSAITLAVLAAPVVPVAANLLLSLLPANKSAAARARLANLKSQVQSGVGYAEQLGKVAQDAGKPMTGDQKKLLAEREIQLLCQAAHLPYNPALVDILIEEAVNIFNQAQAVQPAVTVDATTPPVYK